QRDAEGFAAEDHRRREAVEARNNADQLSYQVDKALSDYGDKIPEADREAVRSTNEEVKEALKGDDLDRIKSSTDALMQAFQKVGQAMYAQQASSEAGGQSAPARSAGDQGTGSSGEGDVVEGEIVDEGGASS